MKTFKITYFIIKPFKRKISLSALSYNDAKKELERRTSIPSKNILFIEIDNI